MPLASSALQPFIGRETELQEITGLLVNSACRMLTLIGPGGIGKTRLALEAARQISVPDGIHVVLCQPLTSPDFMVSTIAEALGIQFFGGTDPKHQLLDYLQDKTMLLVMDNLEHLLDGVTLFSEILAAAPEVRLLITSRERLNLREEWVLDVGGLCCPETESELQIEDYDAVRLFVQHAQRVKTGFTLNEANKPAVIRICRMVGGMPLGIELAAAWVRVLACEAIAEEISQSLDILETPARNVEPRHRSMRAAFEPTWKHLSEAERSVFMKLSVFHGGFTREAAKQVAGASLRILSALVDKSLLQVDANGRYDLHELLRQYAWEKLDQMPELRETILDRHCDYFAEFLHRQEATIHLINQADVLKEIDNLRAVWKRAVQKRNLFVLQRAAPSLYWLYHFQNWLDEGATTFYLAEEAVREMLMTDDNRFLLGMMQLFRSIYRPHQPKPTYPPVDIEAALAHWEGLQERPEMGLPLTRALLKLMANLNPPAQVLAIAQKSLIFSRNHHDLSGEAIALTSLAAINYEALGAFNRARQFLEEALLIDRQIGFDLNAGWSQSILGSIAYIQGQYEAAKMHFEKGVAYYRAGGIKRSLDAYIFGLGAAALELGEDATGQSNFLESLKVASNQQRHSGIARGWAGLGIVAALQSDIDVATAYYEASCASFQVVSASMDRPYYNPDLEGLGLLALLLDYHEYALSYYEAILWHYEKSGYRMPLACLYCRTGQALLGLGDEKRAKAYLFDSLREAADMGAWQMFLESLLGIAQLSDVPSELAIELLVMIEAHPASNRYSRSRAKHLLAAMEAALIADDFAAAMKRGQTLNLPAAAALVEPFRIAPEIVRTTPNQLLSDPLSDRELEVLALIAEGLTNQQIADRLYVGISTVKKHINHIYSKLDATHRAQAVAQARTLKILQ